MYDFIYKQPILATSGLGIGFATVAMWNLSKYVHARSLTKVHDVCMFNELRYLCLREHREHSKETTRFVCANEYCVERLVDRIVQELNHAKYSIDFAMYTFSSLKIEVALKAALKRGVIVRFIFNYHPSHNLSASINNLIMLGVLVRPITSRYLMHHKFCVIDGRERVEQICRRKRSYVSQFTRSVLINGSLNWTDNGCTSNWENLVISSQHEMVNKFETEFFRLWTALNPKKFSYCS